MTDHVPQPGKRSVDGVRIAVMIPQFPQQTHIAWWRVAQQMRWWGADVTMASTRRSEDELRCHASLNEEAERALYVWPPVWPKLIAHLILHPVAVLKGLGYVARLPESGWGEKLKKVPLVIAAAEFVRRARAEKLDAMFVHSCADAAHLAALSRAMGGPRYALRLGGDLEVYGKDHRAKMREAEFIAAGAAGYVPRIVDECGVPQDRAFWTWVGVDCRTFTPGSDGIGTRKPGEPLHVATVARLTDTKGHADGLTAIAALRERGIDIRHSIVGRGPEEPAILAKIEELGLQDRVELLGAMDQGQVVELLRGADVFMLCSYGMGESTPAVVSEAMACGVPVVCTIIGGTTDMMTSGVEGFLVPQRDPAELAEALAQMNDETRRAQMAAKAFEHSAKFDCRLTAQRVLEGFGFVCDRADATHDAASPGAADAAPSKAVPKPVGTR